MHMVIILLPTNKETPIISVVTSVMCVVMIMLYVSCTSVLLHMIFVHIGCILYMHACIIKVYLT